MKYKVIIFFIFILFKPLVFFGQHASGENLMEHVNIDVRDTSSLQRGAKYFVNYCLGCHSAKYVRYNSLIDDLGITEDELVGNLMFTGESPFDTISIAMDPEDAAIWFGITPPDLTLIARSRGTDYLYNFLRGFYVDDSSITGVNNLWLENTAMPHVLWELQGTQKAIYSDDVFDHFEEVEAGTLNHEQYDSMVKDIVTFLSYIGEPIQIERREIGTKVIIFLLIFLLIAYMLKREIWKDIH
ncbi:MAG: hypothetical protein CBC38_01895 [Gammaproteobacteria bacterium TMED78]|nr:MAG: hypothetical protein CBC38_01895 [Gammaproteobacteria bacterium TMED78]|tara:strand:- start:88905 stop:89630 length:726 start_codon:yes stop_codon:yes gene_type:complete